MLNLRVRPSTSIRSFVLRATAGAALLGIAVASSACSGSPSAPGTLSAERRVQTGSGGGTLCPPGVCTGFNGRIEIVASGGSLNGPTVGGQLGSDAARFTLTARLKGSGRFDDGFIDLSVERESAFVRAIWYSSGTRIFQDTEKTVPATVTEVADKACDSGTLIETSITATFENFGRTTITERHCAQ